MSEIPNVPMKVRSPNEYQWATSIKDRRPEFKVHRTIGHAHAAISNRVTTRYGTGSKLLIAYCDCTLFQADPATQSWNPVQHFPNGSQWRCLPWQEDPGDPVERAIKETKQRFLREISDLEYQADNKLDGVPVEVRAEVLKAVWEMQARVKRALG